ncbi:MAG: hypothetical protein K8F36_01440 [Melioribacteraceae bacterium]|nr:hypothetical protein [Melioribacteraceae bacterium]
MKIGIVQFDPIWESPQESIEKLEEILPKAYSVPDLLVLPEMTLTGFTMNSKNFAEEINGISTQYFIRKSAELKTNIFAGVIEKDDHKIYNSLIHIDAMGLIHARYRKIHPFSYAKENDFYDRGKKIVITKIDNYKIGMTVCYDLRFPELYRLYGKERCEIIINIANWPSPRIEHWLALSRAHAIANQCFMISVNRVGNDPYNDYPGKSCVYDPMGKEIFCANDSSGYFQIEINLEDVFTTREKYKFLNDIKLL